jgi:hypothetical protein
MASLIYLASPYSHNNPAVREHRFIQARLFTIRYLSEGFPIFSPIVYGRDMEKALGTDFRSWQSLNDAMVQAASQFWVLQLDGWQDSKGIAHELALARDLRKTVAFLAPLEFDQ